MPYGLYCWPTEFYFCWVQNSSKTGNYLPNHFVSHLPRTANVYNDPIRVAGWIRLFLANLFIKSIFPLNHAIWPLNTFGQLGKQVKLLVVCL